MLLKENIKGLCQENGLEYEDFLNDMEVEHPYELTMYDLEAICDEYKVDLLTLLFKPKFHDKKIAAKLKKVKLLVLDVDGVMTDGGMYFTESGDQFKKYNTKDGLAIRKLISKGFQIAIISSGFKFEVVKRRAEMLGIDRCYVGREPKMNILNKYCVELNISLENVALIGDDINDLEMVKAIGFSACPSDAVIEIKEAVDIVLGKKGGKACVREFIDTYLLPNLQD